MTNAAARAIIAARFTDADPDDPQALLDELYERYDEGFRERNPGLSETRVQEMTECVMRQAIRR